MEASSIEKEAHSEPGHVLANKEAHIEQGNILIDDRKLTTKIDLRILPILGLLYLICFLDRTNIANARIAGLEDGLNMPERGYNTCLWIFYIPFVIFEVPSNIIMSLPWMRPNLWLGGLTFCLGVLAMCQGLTHSYQGLLALRFLMGIVETALPAGGAFLIASYYRKKEVSFRMASFYAFGQGGACFSGLLAYAIMDMDGTAGYEGWRWIFILEGLVTIAFSVPVFLLVPLFPYSKNHWLSPIEHEALILRLEADKGTSSSAPPTRADWLKAAKNYKIWLLTALFFCADMSAGSLSSFNPTILSQLGWTSRRAQVMTIPIWVVGTVVGLVASLTAGKISSPPVSTSSSSSSSYFPYGRSLFIIPAICLSIIGWSLHYAQVNPPAVRYFAQFAISMGTFTQMPMYAGLLLANLRRRADVSLGSALQFGLGNCANFVASNVFIDAQKPAYPTGFGTGLGITCLALPLMVGTMIIFEVHNRRVDEKMSREGEELDEMMDYKYVL